MKKSGIVALSGQPNVGKSTMLNGFLKEKIAIISKKPETTRDTIRGILTEKDCQIVFVDTPGIHKPHDLLGKVMLTRAQSSLMGSDIILFITEKKTAFNRNDENILERLPDPKKGKKVILVLNKIDKLKEKRLLLPIMKKAMEAYPFDEVVPVCALRQDDLDRLLKIIKTCLPEGPFLYPEEQLTDKSEWFLIQEIIREKILTETYEEVPHSVAVVIDEMTEEKTDSALKIYATIFVERTSQKSIVIGRNGAMMKKIGELARADIEQLLSRHIYLDMWVKVREKWKKDPAALREMGYSD
ncbi:MAG: GTPase Era [Candidatus Makaraimicrobium thalassicum]|nr:MAG: GTPase Era [Candidatus Omnitrophota bacterium]